jgi:hypothetical protein
LYATNDSTFQSVTVYPAGAKEDATPIQDITGSYTELGYPFDVAVDGNGDMYVVNREGGSSKEGSITVYAAGATGNVAPIATISGSATGLANPLAIALDPVNGDIYVGDGNSVLFYAAGSNGNVAPLGVITGSKTGLDFVFGLALDKSGNLYVANIRNSSVTVYASGATGNVAPTRRLEGSHTGLKDPYALALDSKSNIYVVNNDGYTPDDSVTVYAARTHGNVAPIQTISGTATKLRWPDGIAVDSGGDIYVADGNLRSRVMVFAAGASGDVKPLRTIRGSNTGLSFTAGIAVR